MKWFFLACTAFALNVSSPVQAEDYDSLADQQILDCTSGSEFQNVIVNYPHEGSEYPIRIVYNPEGKPLWALHWKVPSNDFLIMLSDLPYRVAAHVEELVLAAYQFKEKPYLKLTGFNAIKALDNLRPLHLAERIDDPISDEWAKKAFSSAEFVNQALYYHLDGAYYRVRLLHNPQGLTYSASKKFKLENKPLQDFSISWNYKYGIIIDTDAPQELIDHLSAFTNSSYWDWYFNFKVHNGTSVKYKEVDYWGTRTITTTYTLDTWFSFTEDLK